MASPSHTVASDIRAALGTDLTRELERLKPLKGRIGGNKVAEKIKDELNRFINIFRTGKVFTNAQVCVRLDKEITKLETTLHKAEQAVKAGTMTEQEDIRLRKSIDELASSMEAIVEKVYERGGKKHTEASQHFNQHLTTLISENRLVLEQKRTKKAPEEKLCDNSASARPEEKIEKQKSWQPVAKPPPSGKKEHAVLGGARETYTKRKEAETAPSELAVSEPARHEEGETLPSAVLDAQVENARASSHLVEVEPAKSVAQHLPAKPEDAVKDEKGAQEPQREADKTVVERETAHKRPVREHPIAASKPAQKSKAPGIAAKAAAQLEALKKAQETIELRRKQFKPLSSPEELRSKAANELGTAIELAYTVQGKNGKPLFERTHLMGLFGHDTSSELRHLRPEVLMALPDQDLVKLGRQTINIIDGAIKAEFGEEEGSYPPQLADMLEGIKKDLEILTNWETFHQSQKVARPATAKIGKETVEQLETQLHSVHENEKNRNQVIRSLEKCLKFANHNESIKAGIVTGKNKIDLAALAKTNWAELSDAELAALARTVVDEIYFACHDKSLSQVAALRRKVDKDLLLIDGYGPQNAMEKILKAKSEEFDVPVDLEAKEQLIQAIPKLMSHAAEAKNDEYTIAIAKKGMLIPPLTSEELSKLSDRKLVEVARFVRDSIYFGFPPSDSNWKEINVQIVKTETSLRRLGGFGVPQSIVTMTAERKKPADKITAEMQEKRIAFRQFMLKKIPEMIPKLYADGGEKFRNALARGQIELPLLKKEDLETLSDEHLIALAKQFNIDIYLSYEGDKTMFRDLEAQLALLENTPPKLAASEPARHEEGKTPSPQPVGAIPAKPVAQQAPAKPEDTVKKEKGVQEPQREADKTVVERETAHKRPVGEHPIAASKPAQKSKAPAIAAKGAAQLAALKKAQEAIELRRKQFKSLSSPEELRSKAASELGTAIELAYSVQGKNGKPFLERTLNKKYMMGLFGHDANPELRKVRPEVLMALPDQDLVKLGKDAIKIIDEAIKAEFGEESYPPKLADLLDGIEKDLEMLTNWETFQQSQKVAKPATAKIGKETVEQLETQLRSVQASEKNRNQIIRSIEKCLEIANHDESIKAGIVTRKNKIDLAALAKTNWTDLSNTELAALAQKVVYELWMACPASSKSHIQVIALRRKVEKDLTLIGGYGPQNAVEKILKAKSDGSDVPVDPEAKEQLIRAIPKLMSRAAEAKNDEYTIAIAKKGMLIPPLTSEELSKLSDRKLVEVARFVNDTVYYAFPTFTNDGKEIGGQIVEIETSLRRLGGFGAPRSIVAIAAENKKPAGKGTAEMQEKRSAVRQFLLNKIPEMIPKLYAEGGEKFRNALAKKQTELPLLKKEDLETLSDEHLFALAKQFSLGVYLSYPGDKTMFKDLDAQLALL